MPFTTQEIEQRKQQNDRYGWGYRAASQAKGLMLTEAEMIRVRAAIDSGITPDQLAVEFTPPLPPRERSQREILDVYAHQIAKLTEDMNEYDAVIRQLQEEVGKLQGEVGELKRARRKNTNENDHGRNQGKDFEGGRF